MNNRTKDALIEFIEEIESAFHGCAHMIGTDQIAKVYEKGDRLKKALANDCNIIG